MERELDRRRSLGGTRLRVVSGRAPDNLPLPLTSFIGRERDVAGIEALLGENRLLTLTGSGGSGKTRLALEAGRRLAEIFPDGARFVELAPLTGSAHVARAVASALGAREQPGRPLAATISAHLGSKDVLLVLDNCEHVVGACAALVGAMLRACPSLRVLATSREALGVDGEVKWRVPPLAAPDGSAGIEESMDYEAVRLFVERARSASPSFELTPANARAAAEICRRLEGLPLAIELAAAKVGSLSAEQISARLDACVNLPSGSGRTARHRTLTAALDWSRNLLGEGERRLFERLSVFTGGWTLEAAETMGAEEADTLALLLVLVEKSLVKVEEGDAPRYRLLEPVRQYAFERLKESGEADEVRSQHAGVYLALAEEAEPELAGPEQIAWLERLETEYGNLRAALSWLSSEGYIEKSLRMAAALGARFWNMHSPSEGREWLERGLSGGVSLPKVLRAKALNELGFTAMCQGDFRRTAEALEEGLSLSIELGNERGIAMSLGHLAFADLQNKNHERLSALHRETEAHYRRMEDSWARGYLAISLGFTAMEGGDFDRSTELHEEALELFRELGDLRSISMCLNALGLSALEQGCYARALLLFEEDLRLLWRLKEKIGTHQGLLGMAAVCGARGDPIRAARLWGATEALQEALGLPLLRDFHPYYDYEGRLASARRLLDEETWSSAWAEGRNLSPEQAIEHALESPKAPPQPTFPAGLTAREVEVLRLVAGGSTNADVAKKLFISPRTVNWHLTSIYRKVGAGSRAAAARFAVEHGLL